MTHQTFPKNPRVKDRAYLDGFRDTDCEACGANDGTVVGAHVRTGGEGGTGYKPHDYLTVGLCFDCHCEQEANPGPEWWMRVFKRMLKKRYIVMLATDRMTTGNPGDID